MNNQKIKTFRFSDAAVCLGLLAFAILLFILGNFGGDGKYFTLSCDGKETVYRLDKVQSIELSSNGVALTVACDGKEVWVESSSCPDKCCVNKGKISKAKQIIACAPARVSVSIIGEDGEHDAFTN